jgi:transmembrane sensor
MAPKDLDKLIEKYLAGNATKEESEFINSWYHALGEHPSPASKPLEETISSAEFRILKNLQAHAVPEVALPGEGKQTSFVRTYLGIAASFILLACAGFYFLDRANPVLIATEQNTLPPFISVENNDPNVKRVVLPDGSLVEMSAGSKIRYLRDVNAEARELSLEGEAYFDVARNPEKPFYVYAGDLVTKVLGTSFIIRAKSADEKVIVSVKTGSVTVYSRKASHKKTLLAPNQEVVYDAVKDVLASQVSPAHQPDAVKENFNEMHFEETSVSEVLSTLTRTYDIDIVFDPEVLLGCVLTSSFYEEGLYDRIDVICTAIGATYKVVDAKIVIESKGCSLKPI